METLSPYSYSLDMSLLRGGGVTRPSKDKINLVTMHRPTIVIHQRSVSSGCQFVLVGSHGFFHICKAWTSMIPFSICWAMHTLLRKNISYKIHNDRIALLHVLHTCQSLAIIYSKYTQVDVAMDKQYVIMHSARCVRLSPSLLRYRNLLAAIDDQPCCLARPSQCNCLR